MAAPVAASSSSGSTSTVSPPSGTTAGDTLVCAVVEYDGAASASLTGAGWTSRKATGSIGGVSINWFELVYSSGSSWTIASFSAFAAWACVRLTGASATPYDTVGATNSGNSSTISFTAISTAEADEIVLAVSGDYDARDITVFAGYTEAVDAGGHSLSIHYAAQASAGTTGTPTATIAATDLWVSFLIAYKSAGGGGGAAYVRPTIIIPTSAVQRGSW